MTPSEEAQAPVSRGGSRYGRWLAVVVALIWIYALSAGPVLALGCRMRDLTDWEGFCAVFVLYLPLLPLSDVDLVESYLMWWMHLLDTMPPG
jgi:hypothetical protein